MNDTISKKPSEEFTPEHINFRTKICRHWLKGYCNRGQKCNFAHSWEEVKKRKKESPIVATTTLHYEMKWGTNQTEYNTLEDLCENYDIINHADVDNKNCSQANNYVKVPVMEEPVKIDARHDNYEQDTCVI